MKLSFQLDPSCSGRILAGGTVSGVLRIETPGEHRCSGISLYFRGKEYTRVRYNQTLKQPDGTLTTEPAWDNYKYQFVRIDLRAQNEASVVRGGRICPGSFAVPFSFVLPQTLPGSVSLGGNGGDEASVQYHLRAQLQDSGFLWNYQARKEVEVIAAPRRLRNVPFVSNPCRELGLSIDCSNTHLAADGKQPKIKISIADGEVGKVQVQSVKMRLLRSSSVTTKRYKTSFRHTLCKRELTGKRLLFPDKEIKNLNRLGGGYFDFHKPIPVSVSYDGHNIRVSHSIEVKVVVDMRAPSTELSYDMRTRSTELCYSIPVTIAPAGSRLAQSSAQSGKKKPRAGKKKGTSDAHPVARQVEAPAAKSTNAKSAGNEGVPVEANSVPSDPNVVRQTEQAQRTPRGVAAAATTTYNTTLSLEELLFLVGFLYLCLRALFY